MFLFHILLIFVLIPAAMIAAAAATGPAGARAITYVVFPLALVLFAVAHHLRRGDDEDGRP